MIRRDLLDSGEEWREPGGLTMEEVIMGTWADREHETQSKAAAI
jgi:hypothetical protein